MTLAETTPKAPAPPSSPPSGAVRDRWLPEEWQERALEMRRRQAAARAGEAGLHGLVDEVLDSVLDPGDQEILDRFGAEGGEVLRQLMVDVLGRYQARRRRADRFRQPS